MEKLLVISSSEKSAAAVKKLLETELLLTVRNADSAAEGRRMAFQSEYDAVVIASPLKDEAAEELAVDLAKRTSAGILLIVSEEEETKTEQRVIPSGVFVLARPLGKTLFLKSLRLLEAFCSRIKGIQQQNQLLQQQIDETRIIQRAKSVLIRYLSMTEAQAHKYLEKQAMDLRITKLEVAKRLLSTYDY